MLAAAILSLCWERESIHFYWYSVCVASTFCHRHLPTDFGRFRRYYRCAGCCDIVAVLPVSQQPTHHNSQHMAVLLALLLAALSLRSPSLVYTSAFTLCLPGRVALSDRIWDRRPPVSGELRPDRWREWIMMMMMFITRGGEG